MEEQLQMTTSAPSAVNLEGTVDAAKTISQNGTSKFTPTPEGMACAYVSIMLMALIPIFVGSFKSIKHQVETHAKCRETGEQAETMTDKDAAIFPLVASCALFGFYILMKINPDLVNLAVSGYFFLLGIFAIYRLIKPATHRIFPSKYNMVQYTLIFGSKSLDNSRSGTTPSPDSDVANRSGNTSPTGSNTSLESDIVPTDVMVWSKFTPSDILAFILASILGVWYIITKHWVANNAFGLAFALNGIELLPVNSVRIGCILLCGLFFYDVFWVFGTDVMVSVAKKFDAPIKIVFPQDFLISGFWGKHFAMLGLGDIVIPGIFIAFLLRFDRSLNRKSNTYFWSCFSAYIFGLGLTIGVMSYFKHAQPALLYLVPCCIIIPLLVAVFKGDFKSLLNYRDHPLPVQDEKDEEEKDASTSDESHEPAKDDQSKSVSTRSRSKKNQKI